VDVDSLLVTFNSVKTATTRLPVKGCKQDTQIRFLLLWPWPWIDIRTWPRHCEHVPWYQDELARSTLKCLSCMCCFSLLWF